MLPGEPTDMMEQTRRLAESYIADPAQHTLVCAVLSSRAERVRNSQALGLVQRHGKETETVGVLTMCDLSADPRRPSDPYWLLRDRLTGASTDLPKLERGYVAVTNRDTQRLEGSSNEGGENGGGGAATCGLVAANKDESVWFDEHLPGFGSNGKGLASIESLLSKLAELMDGYARNGFKYQMVLEVCIS